MSCPPEATLLLYVDAELTGEALRALESHLVGCRDCRTRIVTLRDESRWLADVLLERERSLHAHAPARAPERHVGIGLPLAIAAVTGGLALAGLLIETRVPGGRDLLHPLRLAAAYEMGFDLIFWIRDRAPGLLELAGSIGVVAGVSAILTFAAGALYRKVYGAAAAALLVVIAGPPERATALEVRIDQNTQVYASEVVHESMLLSGEVAHIDGVVEGDLIVAADHVTIGGTVKGSLYVLAEDLEISGKVEQSLHGIVQRTRIDGSVGQSAYEAGEIVRLAPQGSIGRDLSLVARTGTLEGKVARDVVFGGGRLELRSQVGRNVDVRWADGVALRSGTRIGGNLKARLPDEADLTRAPDAQVAGAVSIEPREAVAEHYLAFYRERSFWIVQAVGFVASFLFGLLLRLAVPVVYTGHLTTGTQFFRTLFLGLLVILATPLAILVTAATVVGIPVAVLALFVYVVLLYSADLVVSAWLGRLIAPPADESFFAFGRSFLIGLAVLAVAGHVPFLGPPVMIVATLLGAGLLFEQARRRAAPVW